MPTTELPPGPLATTPPVGAAEPDPILTMETEVSARRLHYLALAHFLSNFQPARPSAPEGARSATPARANPSVH
ncbi:MAG TPA: hypothetical protein VL200_08275 [Lacunisphaera sp.]|jgi:hypothetical protein|nr:hypothetical protein [Lacunisphaera sp.]